MKYRLLFVFFLIISGIGASAQQFSLSGMVRDDWTGEPLALVRVYHAASGRSTETNQAGYYNLIIPSGYQVIQYSKGGFANHLDTVYLGADYFHSVSLFDNEYYFIPDTVSSLLGTGEYPNEPSTPQTLSFKPKQLYYIPLVLVQEDLIKTLQMMPGVQGGIEASAGMNVRGGSPDQNLYLLDGMPIYNINHGFGFFSAFQPDAIKHFELHRGGFSSRYGSRLSSILDIGLKDGNSKEFSAAAGLNLFSFYAHMEGPIQTEKTSFLFSFKHTVPGLISVLNPLNRFENNEENGARFYDFTAKITHQLSEIDKVNLTYYRSKDIYFSQVTSEFFQGRSRVREVDEDRLEWGNNLVSLGYQRRISSRLLSNYSIGYSGYLLDLNRSFNRKISSDTGNQESDLSIRYYSGISDGIMKADYEFTPNQKHKIRFGGIYTLHGFSPGTIGAKFSGSAINLDTLLGHPKRIIGNELAAYVEDDIQVSRQFRANIGVRLSSFIVNGKAYFTPEPRAAIRYSLNEHWAFKSSFGVMSQYLHYMNNSGIGLPTDLWVPATEKIKPQRVQHYTATLVRTVGNLWEISAEGYYKRFKNIIDYAEGESLINAEINWENRVEQGIGESYGLEMLVQKRFGEHTGWFGYSWAKSRRQFENINQGQWYDFRFDRRHEFNLAVNFTFFRSRILSLNAVYGTGYPVNFPFGRYLDINGREVYDYQNKNAYRLRDYIRFDLGFSSIRQNNYSSFRREFTISIYNVSNRNNPVFLQLGIDQNSNRRIAEEVSIFPFFPSFSYRLSF